MAKVDGPVAPIEEGRDPYVELMLRCKQMHGSEVIEEEVDEMM